MKIINSKKKIEHYKITFLIAFTLIFLSSCIYMKMEPPADTDKTSLNGNNSCWLATAANMLAGAGYGNGNTLQARATDTYGDLTNNFGTANGGWTDTALTWWLNSTNNTWTNNPYTHVTVYGNFTKNPWTNPNGPKDIGNWLRSCFFIGLSISWPPDQNHIAAYGGHAITGWGDHSGNKDTIYANSSRVRVADSDRDDDGNVQNYRYDSYTNPNPNGNNSGNGWYIDYSPNHPFIKHVITLSPVTNPGRGPVQKVVGSYKIHQGRKTKAIDLHYKVGTDVEILTYRTWTNRLFSESPSITESDPRRSIKVDWDFTKFPVPFCTWVTITTEFILPRWNAIYYRDVHFTYPEGGIAKLTPNIEWKIDTPLISNATKIPNVTGGYVVGSFNIIDPFRTGEERQIGQYRFIHQYSYDQSPENHTFTLRGTQGHIITNLNFGHSYGYLNTEQLWRFQNWMTKISDKEYKLGDQPIKITIDWKGRLPYPEGEIVPWSKDPKVFYLYKKQ
jgi:hypothetical protein